MSSTLIQLHIHPAPCGDLMLGSYDGRLCLCDWVSGRHPGRALARVMRELYAECEYALSDTIRQTIMQLDEYFTHERTVFNLPLLSMGSPFQKSVWQKLTEIPYGHTISYGRLAEMLGRPSAVRAVANANGANPISIIIPCHRVIGSDGSLTGYDGGLDVKRYLLELESNA